MDEKGRVTTNKKDFSSLKTCTNNVGPGTLELIISVHPIFFFQTKELLTYLKELGADEVSDENVGENAVKDVLQLVEASRVCWDQLYNDAGKHSSMHEFRMCLYPFFSAKLLIVCVLQLASCPW